MVTKYRISPKSFVSSCFQSPLHIIVAATSALLMANCAQREGPPAEVVMEEQPKNPIHVVKKGESLTSIARFYNVDKQSIINVNALKRPYRLFVGQRLIIKGSGTSSATPTKLPDANYEGEDDSGMAVTALPTATPLPQSPGSLEKGAHPESPFLDENDLDKPIDSASAKEGFKKSPPPESSGKLKRPVTGKIITSFSKSGPNPNDGINIAAPKGTPVFASESGTVAFAGPTDQGFGNVVIIKHSNDLLTVCAHLDETLVKKGATVTRGQKIGKVGPSGPVKQPQLHFEVRKGSQPVNPETMF